MISMDMLMDQDLLLLKQVDHHHRNQEAGLVRILQISGLLVILMTSLVDSAILGTKVQNLYLWVEIDLIQINLVSKNLSLGFLDKEV